MPVIDDKDRDNRQKVSTPQTKAAMRMMTTKVRMTCKYYKFVKALQVSELGTCVGMRITSNWMLNSLHADIHGQVWWTVDACYTMYSVQRNSGMAARWR